MIVLCQEGLCNRICHLAVHEMGVFTFFSVSMLWDTHSHEREVEALQRGFAKGGHAPGWREEGSACEHA